MFLFSFHSSPCHKFFISVSIFQDLRDISPYWDFVLCVFIYTDHSSVILCTSFHASPESFVVLINKSCKYFD